MFSLDDFLHTFGRVRDRTRRVAACIPEDRLEWTYKPGAFTLGDLVRHIAVAERRIWAETVHGRPVRYTTHGRELADGKDAVLAFLDRMHAEALAEFRALTPAALDAKCLTPAGSPMTTWKWLGMMPEHEIHHRGQIYTMLALLDVPTPPLYGMTADQVKAASTP
ncbi:MAG TPA: DinB family protein [Vicinamibacterales bacterium]|nr:DinB family protein [Vicinamibacterales bacterium]